jgi:hypothetical protein
VKLFYACCSTRCWINFAATIFTIQWQVPSLQPSISQYYWWDVNIMHTYWWTSDKERHSILGIGGRLKTSNIKMAIYQRPKLCTVFFRMTPAKDNERMWNCDYGHGVDSTDHYREWWQSLVKAAMTLRFHKRWKVLWQVEIRASPIGLCYMEF